MLGLGRPAHHLAEHPSVLTWAQTRRCEHQPVVVEGHVTPTEALPHGHTSWDRLKQLLTARESPALEENWKYKVLISRPGTEREDYRPAVAHSRVVLRPPQKSCHPQGGAGDPSTWAQPPYVSDPLRSLLPLCRSFWEGGQEVWGNSLLHGGG